MWVFEADRQFVLTDVDAGGQAAQIDAEHGAGKGDRDAAQVAFFAPLRETFRDTVEPAGLLVGSAPANRVVEEGEKNFAIHQKGLAHLIAAEPVHKRDGLAATESEQAFDGRAIQEGRGI